MFSKSAFTLLRIPFSFYLMPVYFFALSQCNEVNIFHAILIFLILHLFIYPASNGYNSYEDKDESSIGGLKNPPKVTKDLFYLTLLFDVTGLSLSLIVGITFFVGILVYMLVSRAYSFKLIRLKKYPILGFLSVIIFQGAVSFVNIYCGISGVAPSQIISSDILYPVIASSFLIGGVYPLTQIYQHIQDTQSGDKTISMLLGFKGTFIFSALCFVFANIIGSVLVSRVFESIISRKASIFKIKTTTTTKTPPTDHRDGQEGKRRQIARRSASALTNATPPA